MRSGLIGAMLLVASGVQPAAAQEAAPAPPTGADRPPPTMRPDTSVDDPGRPRTRPDTAADAVAPPERAPDAVRQNPPQDAERQGLADKGTQDAAQPKGAQSAEQGQRSPVEPSDAQPPDDQSGARPQRAARGSASKDPPSRAAPGEPQGRLIPPEEMPASRSEPLAAAPSAPPSAAGGPATVSGGDTVEAPVAPPVPDTLRESDFHHAACRLELLRLGTTYRESPPIADPGERDCGIMRPVEVQEILPGIVLEGGASMRCDTARELAHWLEEIVIPAAGHLPGAPRLTALSLGTTYECRGVVGGSTVTNAAGPAGGTNGTEGADESNGANRPNGGSGGSVPTGASKADGAVGAGDANGADGTKGAPTNGAGRLNGAPKKKLSEHAVGNAIDIAGFTFDDGTTIRIEPVADGDMTTAFRHAVQGAACLFFSTVLGPGSNAAHDDHLHLDIKARRGGHRLCQ